MKEEESINPLSIIDEGKIQRHKYYMSLPKERLAELLAESPEMGCDNCGCHPNYLITTQKGRLCQECYNMIFGIYNDTPTVPKNYITGRPEVEVSLKGDIDFMMKL
jgi:hypothetical protein